MAFIHLNNELPGIRGLLAYRKETAKPMGELVEILLRDDNNTLSRGDRELIATYVSYLNDCNYCQNVHGALAQHYMQCDTNFIEQIKNNVAQTAISAKLKALLHIAAKVQQSGKAVLAQDIESAKQQGASDMEIHDTVLIAAAFCMFNRYVDGLGTEAPTEKQFYIDRAARRATEGYIDFDLYK